MKKILLLIICPFLIFSQETTLVGDVDCNGQVNSEDASLILQYVTNVIGELPCQENMTGLTPDQLAELVDMMSGQLTINYGGVSFGDWVVQHDNPIFDNFLYGQAEEDGFLLIQYSRENQITSAAAFGFNIHTGSDIDTINFVMDISINVATSFNPINSKTIPIKKGDYWVIENIDDLFATEVNIDKVYFLPINGEVSINESDPDVVNNALVSNKSIVFPDGHGGDPVTWSLDLAEYAVPEGKNLYITQYHNTNQNDGMFIEGVQITKGHSNSVYYIGVGFSPSNTNNLPIVVGADQIVTGNGSFNGFLIDAIVSPIIVNMNGLSWDNWSGDDYEVPADKVLYILQFYGGDDSALLIDDVPIIENYSNNIFYTGVGFTPAMTLSMPILVGPGQIVTGFGGINGYLVDLNYFSE